jgi:hypothetical protein
MWANRMKEHFDQSLQDGRLAKTIERVSESGHPTVMIASFFCDDPGIFMSYWYGGLYVVIEGWQDLSLHDSKIDSLLTDPKVAMLKRYRNGAFHFQKDYWDDRFRAFVSEKDAAQWVRQLNKEFGRWFLEHSLNNRGADQAAP